MDFRKVFGVGPAGALVTLALLAAALLIDRALGHLPLLPPSVWLKYLAVIPLALAVGLHFWSLFTLRNWWRNNQLCTGGPFKYLRHPMYAAWITVFPLALVLLFNSPLVLLAAMAAHPFWHHLVQREEVMMSREFGDQYQNYAQTTGRFFPRLWGKKQSHS